MIRQCFCTAEKHGAGAAYQDEKYGKQNRVFNELKDKKGYRCTVCGREATR